MATHTTMTAEQFDSLPAEELRRFELLDGELVEMSSRTPEHNRIVGRVFLSLTPFLEKDNLGSVLTDSEFVFASAARFRPDLAVLLGEKWTKLDRLKTPVRVIPDVVFEVISPSESAVFSDRKVTTYLESGVAEVIVIYPDTRHIYVVSPTGAAHYWSDAILQLPSLFGWSMPAEQIFG